jgi:hypothetical protein
VKRSGYPTGMRRRIPREELVGLWFTFVSLACSLLAVAM